MLLHQEHLAGALDRAIQLALIMSGQAGVFSGKDSALVSDELTEQVDILVVERIEREIDLRFRTWGPNFHCPIFSTRIATVARFVGISFAWHRLANFPVQSVSAQEAVIFH